jgi:hypothetical protein
MTEEWPDSDAPYQYPERTRENARRWKAAIEKSLDAGLLQLEESGHYYRDLVGVCPRCGHEMSQQLSFGTITNLWPGKKRYSGVFNIRCNCSDESHSDRPEGTHGCGWGGANPVNLQTE